mgnify:CR=1 FL=1
MIYIKLCLIANRHGRKILFRRKKIVSNDL